ncbi:ABC transporter permease [Streptosporangium sp. NPDC004379]|uniref:ABC transporter permease n=1 Tax=Streptosporangium sp. NPDC004379 TaxID=3366189 RepID=UPI003689748A
MTDYVRLEALRMLRNKRYVIFVVVFPVVFYLIFSSVYGDQADAGGLSGRAYFLVSMSAYGGLAASLMSTAVPWAQERGSGWLRQLQITPLAGWKIITTKLIASMLLVLPAILLVSAAAMLFQGVSMPPGRWLGLLAAMWLGVAPFTALGLAVGSLLPPDTAQPVSMMGMFALALFGGLWIPLEVMPEGMRGVARLLPSADYVGVGHGIVAGDGLPPGDLLALAGWAVVLGVIAVLAYRRAVARA